MNQIEQKLQEKVAELEQQQEIVRQQEQFLRSIYDNVREAIFVVDLDSEDLFRYQGFNLAAQKLTGIKDVINKTPKEILAPEVAAAVELRYQECLQTGTSICYEECLIFEGKESWWLTTLNPIQNESGQIYRIIGISLNISHSLHFY